jgi:hypothetical protein
MRRRKMEPTRKTYKKPEIIQVKLTVEEAVLQACKTTSSEPSSRNKRCGHPQCRTTLGS